MKLFQPACSGCPAIDQGAGLAAFFEEHQILPVVPFERFDRMGYVQYPDVANLPLRFHPANVGGVVITEDIDPTAPDSKVTGGSLPPDEELIAGHIEGHDIAIAVIVTGPVLIGGNQFPAQVPFARFP